MPNLAIYMEMVKKLDGAIQQNTPSIESDLLGAQEALTKLWVATQNNQDKEMRVANVFFAAFLLAARCGITDLDGVVKNRIEELAKQK